MQPSVIVKQVRTFHRYIWFYLLIFGVLLYVNLVHILAINNPTYVFDDTLVRFSSLIIPIGGIGSVISVYNRFGLKKSLPLFTIWGLVLISMTLFHTGIGGLATLGFALVA